MNERGEEQGQRWTLYRVDGLWECYEGSPDPHDREGIEVKPASLAENERLKIRIRQGKMEEA